MGQEAIQFAVDFSQITCCDCSITFCVPAAWERKRRENKDSFCCPNGHRLHFTGETEADKIRRELEYEKRKTVWAQNARDAAQAREKMTEHRRRAAQGQITKLRKRVSAGVCPCCSRTFGNLGRHMNSKHPGYGSEA